MSRATQLGREGVWQTELPGLPPPRRGKVRDLYDLGEALLLVACDRISAYDHVLHPAIPGKGKVLNQLSNFWFGELADLAPNHLLATEPDDFPAALRPHAGVLRGRAVLVRKTRVVPFECVARGYLAGSAFREYRDGGAACGIALPPGLQRASRLPEPIFTPATKEESGHDVNVSEAVMAAAVGARRTATLRRLTLEVYRRGAAHAATRGLLLADTKLEFGELAGELLLIDEVLTPDSSRYWDGDAWRPGEEPASFDKQYVRNWLDETGWDHESPPPELPPEVVEGTLQRYVEAFRRITGREPDL
ncbi:MAG TPA: phosphoribosylaminoimidazolesuccinocarboxamide synthase [Thermoanaerobaculia bacterium]|nr:phosphoribosylaminoimidazolesuccinocarboxamide synthase [Thermoanaerobaculia bacterium]